LLAHRAYQLQSTNSKGLNMKNSKLIFAIPAVLVLALALSACEKPTVVNVPSTTAAVPGPAGPPGAQGNQGNQGKDGTKGDAGKPGDATTVIVVPPEPTPTPALPKS
jgi:hypothetical protein